MSNVPVPSDDQWRDKFQLQGTEGFEHFVSRFFNVCQVPGYQATFWIIKLTMKDGKGNSRTFFAAGRNDYVRHVENVFIEWWNAYQPQMEQQGYTCNEVKVYTNYTPCSGCALTLREWLAARPHIEFSIHYVFMYIDTQEVQMQELTTLENVVGVQRIDEASLRQLAEDVGFEQPGYGYQIPDCWRQADHERINYP